MGDSRGTSSRPLVPFACYLLKNNHPTRPTRVKELTRDNLLAYTGEPKEVRSQTLTTSLNPGLYVLLVAAYQEGMQGNFNVSLLSNYRADLKYAWPPNRLMQKKLHSRSDKERLTEPSLIEVILKKRRQSYRAFKTWFAELFNADPTSDDDDDDDDDDDGLDAKEETEKEPGLESDEKLRLVDLVGPENV